MKISKRAFFKKFNIEAQWMSSLCNMGIIPVEAHKSGKRVWLYVDESSIVNLVSGEHYVECPVCKKKMACVTKRHGKICLGGRGDPLYSKLYLEIIKKDEDQKIAQSITLKNRFKTDEGEKTRQQISEASKKLNSDPDFIKKKREYSTRVQNQPAVKKLHSEKAKEMWSDPEFVARNREYVKKNSKALSESAANARKYSNKTSKLHLSYKKSMEEAGLKGFITEYLCGYYSIDEADPFAKIAVEIDGCYWHGCSTCGLEGNKRISLLDKRKGTYLKNRGWVVIHVKEHEIKANPQVCIEMIRTLQKVRRNVFSENIKQAFKQGGLKVRAMPPDSNSSVWIPVSDIVRHSTAHKKIIYVHTEKCSIKVTEDHSLFLYSDKKPVTAGSLSVGDKIVGITASGDFESLEIVSIEYLDPEKHTYDLSVPGAENFSLASGILAHNSYNISGISLDLDKSSKYESMKNNFYQEADKSQELAKRSIKVIRGLSQPRYGVGISSALGPYSRPGVQSRRNFTSGFRGGWS